ncbi:hypothetical protein NP233_g11201 [Leucocoprinus birnbaumii]|nr:hypothetical protein NP233_g11201 [Leucocoprinus birnbaumii]
MQVKLLSVLALASFALAQEPSSSGGATGTETVPTTASGAAPSGSGLPPGTQLPPCINTCINQAAGTAGCDP